MTRLNHGKRFSGGGMDSRDSSGLSRSAIKALKRGSWGVEHPRRTRPPAYHSPALCLTSESRCANPLCPGWITAR